MIKLNSLVIKSTREIPAPAWPPSGSWTMCARLYVNTSEDHICMNTVSWYYDGGSSYTYSDPDCNNYLDNLSQWNDGTEDTYLPISGQDSNGKYVNIFTNGEGGSVGNPWDFCVILANGRVNPISDDSWSITKVDVVAANSSTYYSYDNPDSPYQGQWLRDNDVSNWTQHQVSGGGTIISTKLKPITYNITSSSGPAKAYSKFKIEMLGTVEETGDPGRYCQWCKVGLGWNGNNPVYGQTYYAVESYNLVNGTYFATWSNNNYPPSNLFVDDLNKKIDWIYNTEHKDNCYLEVIFTTNESIIPTSIGLIAASNANSYPQRPEYFKLYGWDNGWNLITVVYGEDTASGSNAESIFNISSTSSTIIRPLTILENIPDPSIPSDMDFIYYANDFTGSYIPNSAPNSTFGNYMAQGTLYKNGSGANCYLSNNWWEIEEVTPGFLKKELTQTELNNIMATDGTYTFFIRVMNDTNLNPNIGGIMSCRYNGGINYMIRSNYNQIQIHHSNGGVDLGDNFLISSDNVYKIQISGNNYYAKNLTTGYTTSLYDDGTKEMGNIMTTFTAWEGNENTLCRFYAMAGIARSTTEGEDTIIKNCLFNQSNG